MDDRLVVRWAFLARLTRVGMLAGINGVLLASVVPTRPDWDERALLGATSACLLAFTILTIVRPRYVFDAGELRVLGWFSTTAVRWDRTVAVCWVEHTGPPSAGRSLVAVGRDGRRRPTRGLLPEVRIADVDDWLREHQPEIRIDPTPPWRDRFGTWHVGAPGYDPVETMMSIRRSFVGPWEIVARSCDAGFRAEQRVVKGGAVVHIASVRETLAAAKEDGVRLVREAVEAAASAHE